MFAPCGEIYQNPESVIPAKVQVCLNLKRKYMNMHIYVFVLLVYLLSDLYLCICICVFVFVYLYLCIFICGSEKVLESGLIHVCGGQRRPRRENLALVGDHRALLIAIIGR